MMNKSLLLVVIVLLTAHATKATDEKKCLNPSTDDTLSGFSVFQSLPRDHDSFKQDLHTMVTLSKSEPGLVEYHMYENPAQRGTFGFFETWETKAFEQHLKGENVKKIFTHPYYHELKTSSQLYGPWVEVPPAKDTDAIELTFYWNMDCPKKYIWDIITDWNNASWVLGSPKTEILDGDIQRRIWSNGLTVDVRIVYKNETNFTVVEETIGGNHLFLPTVDYNTFYVTMSLSDENLDPDTQTRLRYHMKATLSHGTFEQGREVLKSDFYGPRIAAYQKYFNCSRGISVKRALTAVENLHNALRKSTSEESLKNNVSPFFSFKSDSTGTGFVSSETFVRGIFGGSNFPSKSLEIEVFTPIKPIVLPDLRVVAVEDVYISSLLTAVVKSRIVIYQLNEFGQIISARIFNQNIAENPQVADSPVYRASQHYFDVIHLGDIEKVRPLYAAGAVLEDPVGFLPPRNFSSVYEHFYELQKSFEYRRSPKRTFVLDNQVAFVVDAEFVLLDGSTLSASPVQVITFNANLEITHFEAFFKPSHFDFTKF